MKKDIRPRILFVGTLPPPIHGSAVVSLQIKNSKLINESFRCDWINLGTSRRMDEIGKRTLAKPLRFIGALLRMLLLLIVHRYALCYLAITCRGRGFLKDAPFMLLARLFCQKRIIHQHNKGMSKYVDIWPYRWLLPLCYKDAKVILLSWHLYPDIERIVKRENVLICPNGIKVNTKDSHKENKKKTNKIPRLLFLSNLIESKGVIVLLDALKLLADKGYSFQCDFVGGETKEIDANRFAEEVNKRQLNRLVVYQGRKYGDEKEEAFEMSDIFVFPTYNEAFGLVLLEAMSFELPSVTTDEGSIPDIVENGVSGLIAKRKDPQSLSYCIEKLINDKELRQQMGISGRKMVERFFTEEKFEERMNEILTICC